VSFAAPPRARACHSSADIGAETPLIRVLIVDDHRLFTHALDETLTRDGRFEVVGTAATGREAVLLARQTPVDVVLMDLSMPLLDGLAATRRLLALDRPPRVIALSGRTDALSRNAALEAGAEVFLSKSEDYTTVADTIVDVYQRV
jgi:DNA-binding NarL/FixJ family response regulator